MTFRETLLNKANSQNNKKKFNRNTNKLLKSIYTNISLNFSKRILTINKPLHTIKIMQKNFN